MTQAFQDHQIRQYLLGDLPAAEEGDLETAYFRDSELLARVELTRDDLADDYAAGRLSDADREKFERRLLASGEGREQLAITRALQQAAVAAPQKPLKPVWRLDRRWLSLAALVPLTVGVLIAWQVMSRSDRVDDGANAGRQPTIQAPVANSGSPSGATAPAAQPPSSVPGSSPEVPPLTLATLILTANLERSRGVPPTLLTSTRATHVDLVVPRAGLAPGEARARVESIEGARVWSGSMTVPAANAADPGPRVRLPLTSLAPGDYLLSIEVPADATGGPRYYFRVRN